MRRLAFLILVCLLLVSGASALDGYSYYQTIDYAATDVEAYQQDLVVHRTTGTAYNETSGGLETWHIYVGEHCRNDYGDIQFTDADGAELAYYLWPDYTSSSARFAVRLENATVAGTLIVYYGNTTATTTSDGNTVYLLFDHFDGTTLNETKWSKVGTPTISNSWVRVDSSNEEIRSLQTFGVNTILEGKGNIYPAAYHIFGWGIHPYVPISIFQYGYPASGVYNARNHVTSTVSVSLGSGLTGNHTWAIHRAGTGSTKFYVDNALVANLTSQVPTTNMPVLLQQHVTGTGNSNFDYILVRAYSATPPASTAFSGEYQTAAPPATSFTANITAGLAPLTVQFTDTSLGSPTSWLWSFGDGNTSTARNPVHTYTVPGTYSVNLTATNEYGSSYELKTDYITVYAPVTASFTANIISGIAPLTVQFTDTSLGSPTSWLWSFGDGNTSTARHPVHTYTTEGAYTVTLTASHLYSSDTITRTNYIIVAVLQPFPGIAYNPTDPNGDGLCEDVNGNGRIDYNDLTIFFLNLEWARISQPAIYFDFNGNGRIDYVDVISLFQVIIHA